MYVTTYLFHPLPHHFSEVCHVLLSEPWILQSLNWTLEEKVAIEKQNTQTKPRLAMGCNQQQGAAESQARIPLAKLLPTSLNLKMSFKKFHEQFMLRYHTKV